MITISRAWIAAAILVAGEAPEAGAQVAEPAGAAAPADTIAQGTARQMSESERFSRRFGAAFFGQIPISLVGAAVGANLADDLNIRCDCLIAGADEGALLGAVLGASMFAALPDLGSSCSGGRRWRRALLGSIVGVSPSLVAWAASGRREFLFVTGMLAPIGAAGGTHPC